MPASIWKLNGANIYVNEYTESIDPTIAELNPINSTDSVYHFIFTPDDSIEIQGYVIGSGYIGIMEAGVGGLVTLITDLKPAGVTVLFDNIKVTRVMSACQLIDTTQSTLAPVYQVTCSLRK
jgi:hypothetical protein